MCKINLKCVRHHEISVSLSVFKKLQTKLIYILYMIWRDLFVCSSTEEHIENPLSKAHIPAPIWCNIRCTAYRSFIPKPFVSSNKETSERIVACIEAIRGCYRLFYGFRVFILSKDLLILHKMINWRNPRLFSLLIFVIHSGFLQEITGQIFQIHRLFRIRM